MADINAAVSCHQCHRSKRKCDKRMPSCASCKRVGKHCEYGSHPFATPLRGRAAVVARRIGAARGTDANSDFVVSLDDRHNDRSPEIDSTSQTSRAFGQSKLPALWFLDSMVARGKGIKPTSGLDWRDVSGMSIAPPSIAQTRQIVQNFFSSVNNWFPIVSKVRITRALDDNDSCTSADFIALVYAMNLLCTGPSRRIRNPAERSMYHTVKLALAQILITTYETAHALYPAAYLSVGTCSRLCYVLGLHDKYWATQLRTQWNTWTEMEECRRLWWATMILDRMVHAGFRFRPLATPPIPVDEIVPADDEAWHRGEIAVNPLVVMSIDAKMVVSPFARTCQAAHLLGKVCHHVNEHPKPLDPHGHFDEARHINATVSALLSLVLHEKEQAAPTACPKYFSAIGLCITALMTLYDTHVCIEPGRVERGTGLNTGQRLELQQLVLDNFGLLLTTVKDLMTDVREAIVDRNYEISPFILNALYQAGGTFAWYCRENGSQEHLASLSEVRSLLENLDDTWMVAGEYHKLLEGAEFQSSSLCVG